MSAAKSVTTTDGKRYLLGGLLGQGGQGKVFAVKGHPYAVKLLSHRPLRPAKNYKSV